MSSEPKKAGPSRPEGVHAAVQHGTANPQKMGDVNTNHSPGQTHHEIEDSSAVPLSDGPSASPQGLRRGTGPIRKGGVISNTPPPSSIWIAAEDWFELNLYVKWHPTKWDELTKKLDECKHWAGIRDSPTSLTGWNVNGKSIAVEPIGAKSGKGTKGIYSRWRFTYDELIRFRVVNRQLSHETMPNVGVSIDGRACTLDHAENLYRRSVELIEALGGEVLKNKLSRVDICLDMPGVPLDAFERCFDEKRYICRANARSKHESYGITVSFGQNPIMARIYDKLREVEKKADPVKELAMKVHRWGGDFPDEATRVEFQIRRDGLKSHGIDTVQDYLDRRASLASYLTEEWLRLTAAHVDKKNKNQSKARTLPLWQEVSENLVAWGAGATAELDPLKKEDANVLQLFKQMLGVAKAAAKFQGKDGLTDKDLLAYTTAKLQHMLRCEQKPNR
jgi:hypothetical protein